MYNFNDIVKDYHYLCDTINSQDESGSCKNCPFINISCSCNPFDFDTVLTDSELNTWLKTLSNWIKNHPRPHYPTYRQIIATEFHIMDDLIESKLDDEIPESLAKELGIKGFADAPKEKSNGCGFDEYSEWR